MIAGLDRIAKELRSVRRVQQAQFAFIDTLVKVILTCLPEPGGEVYTQAKSPRDGTIRRILKERRQGHGWRFKGSAGRIGSMAKIRQRKRRRSHRRARGIPSGMSLCASSRSQIRPRRPRTAPQGDMPWAVALKPYTATRAIQRRCRKKRAARSIRRLDTGRSQGIHRLPKAPLKIQCTPGRHRYRGDAPRLASVG
jgi:hypothetical protein